ncbi:MAG: hypothetical protein GQ574_22615 [Crocinitomix sp.]|nr:hypothetical protein [Crocinitomix sp.]
MTKKLQLSLLLIIFVIGIVWFNHYLLFSLTAISAVLGFRKFSKDRKELKETRRYCRVKKLPSKKRRNKTIISLVVFLGLYSLTLFLLYKFVPEKYMDNAFSIYVTLTMFTYFIGEYYQGFVGSIRSFEKGIKLPGRDAVLLPWSGIKEIYIEEQEVTIQHNNDSNSWILNKKDVEDMKQMIADWMRLKQTTNSFSKNEN